MSRARDLSDLVGTQGSIENILGERKNVIINGDFDVWQRGTGAFTTQNDFTADRWQLQRTTTTNSVTQSSFTLGQTDVPNEPKHYLTAAVTTASGVGTYALVRQKVESVRTLAGQGATLSFWAKADAAKDIAVQTFQSFGTSGSPSSNVTVNITTCSLTTSWQRFEIALSIPSISGKTIGTDNNDYLGITFWLEAGSNFNASTNSLGNQSGTFDIAQVQLEKGSQATAFEKRSYGEELALCHRYYFRHYVTGNQRVAISGNSNNTSSAYPTLYFPQEMRTSPSLSNSTPVSNFQTEQFSGGIKALTSLSMDAVTNKNVTLACGTASTHSGGINLTATSGNTVWVALDAEL